MIFANTVGLSVSFFLGASFLITNFMAYGLFCLQRVALVKLVGFGDSKLEGYRAPNVWVHEKAW